MTKENESDLQKQTKEKIEKRAEFLLNLLIMQDGLEVPDEKRKVVKERLVLAITCAESPSFESSMFLLNKKDI